MSTVVWRIDLATREKFLILLLHAHEAEARHDFSGYMACIDQIRSLPGFPTDYDPAEDEIHVERYETIYSGA